MADEELGKKNDDHRPRESRAGVRMTPWKWPRPRRVILAAIIVCLLYLFFKNIPADMGPAAIRARNQGIPLHPLQPLSPPFPNSPPYEYSQDTKKGQNGPLDGSFVLTSLGNSLRRVPKTSSEGPSTSSAVVFAGSDLKSVSDLVPLACHMARLGLNSVHFVLMGRDDVSLDGVQQVNGVDYNNCPMSWHGMSW